MMKVNTSPADIRLLTNAQTKAITKRNLAVPREALNADTYIASVAAFNKVMLIDAAIEQESSDMYTLCHAPDTALGEFQAIRLRVSSQPRRLATPPSSASDQ